MICGVRKFQKYLWDRHINIYTDHYKPLLGLLRETEPLPLHSSARLYRWALLMQRYDYELINRSGKSIANADALSRLPLPVPERVLNLLQHLEESPVKATLIKEATKFCHVFCNTCYNIGLEKVLDY